MEDMARKGLRCGTLAVGLLLGAGVRVCGAHELSLAEALTQAEHNSPRLKAANLQVVAAHKGVGVAQAGYYPSVALEGIDSWGFPGSSGALGIGGLMGSPYRSEAAAGLVAQDTLFDFGRTYSSVRAAQDLEMLRRAGIDVESSE